MNINFIHIEIRTNYHKNFALRLALKERLSRSRKWYISLWDVLLFFGFKQNVANRLNK